MKLYIITRFSVYDPTRQDFLDSREELFADARLTVKFDAFRLLTVPSIQNMAVAKDKFMWIVLTSTWLPGKWVAELRRLLDWCGKPYEIRFLEPRAGVLFQALNELRFERPYTTCRLDDDDALCPEYYNLLCKYGNEKDNTIVSFVCGRTASIVDGAIQVIAPKRLAWNAQGMARINGNVFLAGNHIDVAKGDAKTRGYKVIGDKTPDVYLRFMDKMTLSQQKEQQLQSQQQQVASPAAGVPGLASAPVTAPAPVRVPARGTAAPVPVPIRAPAPAMSASRPSSSRQPLVPFPPPQLTPPPHATPKPQKPISLSVANGQPQLAAPVPVPVAAPAPPARKPHSKRRQRPKALTPPKTQSMRPPTALVKAPTPASALPVPVPNKRLNNNNRTDKKKASKPPA